MKFKIELLKHFQNNIKDWCVTLDKSMGIVITIDDEMKLKLISKNFKNILWLTLPEIPCKATAVRFIITNKERTNEYYYNFTP